jgi:hypothetical protein
LCNCFDAIFHFVFHFIIFSNYINKFNNMTKRGKTVRRGRGRGRTQRRGRGYRQRGGDFIANHRELYKKQTPQTQALIDFFTCGKALPPGISNEIENNPDLKELKKQMEDFFTIDNENPDNVDKISPKELAARKEAICGITKANEGGRTQRRGRGYRQRGGL